MSETSLIQGLLGVCMALINALSVTLYQLLMLECNRREGLQFM
jgi:hypothetical protein